MSEKKSKILLVGSSLRAVSGVSTHLNQLLNSRLSEIYQFLYFQIGSHGRQESSIEKLLRFIFSPFQLALKIILTRPQIIHLNTSIDRKAFWRDVFYLLIAKVFFVKIVYQVHGGPLPQDFFRGNKVLTAFMKWIFKLTNAIVLLAEIEREAYSRFIGVRHLAVIPNAIDLTPFNNATQKNFDEDRLKLVYLGALTFDKGVYESIDAIALLKDKLKNNSIIYQIAGAGPDEQNFINIVDKLGISDLVEFKGVLYGEEKDKMWNEAHLFVFPTFHAEGLPYAVLESIASGTPLITTRVGANPDVLTDGLHGYLIEPKNPKLIADTILKMINDRKILKEMSLNCIKRAHEYYGINRLANQFDELYQLVLKN